MYVVTVIFDVVDGMEEQFGERVLRQARDSLEREEACHVFTVSRNPESPGRFFLYEEYTDEAAFQLHLESSHFVQFNEECSGMVKSKTVNTYLRVG